MGLAITRTITISERESLNSLGVKLSQMIDLGTLSGLDATNGSSSVMIPYYSSVVPATYVEDARVWHLSATNKLDSVFGGSSFQKRWEPMVMGCAMINGTASTRVPNDVVCTYATSGDLTSDLPCTTGNIIVGAYQVTTASGSYGIMKSFGRVTLAASGVSIARGAFVKANTVGSTYSVVSSGTILDGSCGVALAAAVGNAVDVLMWGHNKT